MSENLVEVKHLQQYFPAGGMGKNKQYVQAVDDVSFAIRKGETLGLVGESGCGKTTTGRTLLRLYEPTDGTIIYDGKVLFDKKEKIAVDMLPYRRRMQIVFQDPYASLDPRMTIGDIVGEGIDIHHLCANAKERHDKIISLLERVGLNSEHANRYPHEFSGGQRQRMGSQRPAVQLGHQLVAAEPPPQPRGHDDAAQRRHRAVQIVHKGVRVGAERAQERGVLLADDRENAADFQHIQHTLLKIRAAALQIAKLVQHGPAAGHRHPLQGGQPHGGKAGWHGAHPVFTGGQGGIKPADDRRCPGGCIAHLDPSARDGSGEKHRGIGAEG